MDGAPPCVTIFAAVASDPAAGRWPRTGIVLCSAQPAVTAVLRRLGGRLELPIYDTVDQALDHTRTRPPLRRERHRLAPTIQARAAARQLLAEVGSNPPRMR